MINYLNNLKKKYLYKPIKNEDIYMELEFYFSKKELSNNIKRCSQALDLLQEKIDEEYFDCMKFISQPILTRETLNLVLNK